MSSPNSPAAARTRLATTLTRAALRSSRATMVTVAAVLVTTTLGVASTTSAAVQLTATTALIMGGTGVPTPNQEYMDAAIDRYIKPALGGDYLPTATYTPEEGLGNLPGETMSITQSEAAGVPYLESAIANYSGQPIVVFGYSQSGAIGAIVKNDLAAYAEAHPDAPVPDVTFVLLACGCRANGAQEFRQGSSYDTSIVDSRARTDTPFKTIDVAWQYDISSDAPLYPLNVVAELNWLLGGLYVHTNYLPLPPELGGYPNGGQTPTLDGLQGVTAPGLDTTYYLIPSEHLPLFGPLRSLGVPESLIDIVEPLARVIVEWGYDRTIPPWEPTAYRLIPLINPITAIGDLINATGQGIINALKAIGLIPPNSTSATPVALNAVASATSTSTASQHDAGSSTDVATSARPADDAASSTVPDSSRTSPTPQPGPPTASSEVTTASDSTVASALAQAQLEPPKSSATAALSATDAESASDVSPPKAHESSEVTATSATSPASTGAADQPSTASPAPDHSATSASTSAQTSKHDTSGPSSTASKSNESAKTSSSSGSPGSETAKSGSAGTTTSNASGSTRESTGSTGSRERSTQSIGSTGSAGASAASSSSSSGG